MKFSKLGLIFSLAYLGIFLLTAVYAIYVLAFHTADSKFSGIFSILVTLPWSTLLSPLIDSVGYVSWYEQFAGTPALYGFFAMLGLLPSALINASLFYLIGSLIGRVLGRKNAPQL